MAIRHSRLVEPKPPMWGLNPHQVDSKWDWFYQHGFRVFAPFWHRGNSVTAGNRVGAKVKGDISGAGVSIEASELGLVLDGDGTNVLCDFGTNDQDGNAMFAPAEPWTCGVLFTVRQTGADENGLFDSRVTSNPSSTREFGIYTRKQTAPAPVRIRHGNTNLLDSSSVVELNTWYWTFGTCDGTGATLDKALSVWELGKGLLSEGTYTRTGTSGSLDQQKITTGSSFSPTNDAIDGQIAFAFYTDVQFDSSQQAQLNRDPFGPLRRARRRSFFVPAAPAGAVPFHQVQRRRELSRILVR